jgi:hypothetical protein
MDSNFGVAVFGVDRNDSGLQLTSMDGWACAHDFLDKPVDSISDLPDDRVWITDLSAKFLIQEGFGASGYLLPRDFFDIDIDVILLELGALALSNREKSRLLSRVFHHVISFGGIISPSSGISPRYSLSLIGDDVDSRRDTKDPNSHLGDLFSNASGYRLLSDAALTPAPGTVCLVLSKPRFNWVKDLFPMMVPKGRLREVSERLLPPPSERVSWLLASEKPAFCLVDINNMTREDYCAFQMARGVPFNGEDLKPVMTFYDAFVSSADLAFLRTVADVYVKKVFISTEVGSLHMPFRSDGYRGYQISYSYGLLSHSMVLGSTSRALNDMSSAHWLGSIMREAVLNDYTILMRQCDCIDVRHVAHHQMILCVPETQANPVSMMALEQGYVPYSQHPIRVDDVERYQNIPQRVLSEWSISSNIEALMDKDSAALAYAKSSESSGGSAALQFSLGG